MRLAMHKICLRTQVFGWHNQSRGHLGAAKAVDQTFPKFLMPLQCACSEPLRQTPDFWPRNAYRGFCATRWPPSEVALYGLPVGSGGVGLFLTGRSMKCFGEGDLCGEDQTDVPLICFTS